MIMKMYLEEYVMNRKITQINRSLKTERGLFNKFNKIIKPEGIYRGLELIVKNAKNMGTTRKI